jgi:hypothetical protein
MDAAALAGLCVLLARGASATALPPGVSCPAPVVASPTLQATDLRTLTASDTARDAIARVTFAEAGNQGDSGLAAVVYTILNRLQDGRWGSDVEAVVNARGQFEPVTRAGGDWRRLRPVSAADRARIDTILNLALDGRLPDLTHGARYFQNPQIVAARAREGTVSAALVDFGGATPSAQIGAHRFYVDTPHGRGREGRAPSGASARGEGVIFVGASPAASVGQGDLPAGGQPPSTDDPSHALFVRANGQVSSAWR